MAKTTEQKRQYNRRHYERHNAHRLGGKRGPKPGTVYHPPEGEDRDRVEVFREEQEILRVAGVRDRAALPRTCEFCDSYGYRHDQCIQQCDLGVETVSSGTCGRWTPRYKTTDDGDEGVPAGESGQEAAA